MSESTKDFEWCRTRLLREKHNPTVFKDNRAQYLMNQVLNKHGDKALSEIHREFNSRSLKSKGRDR